MALIRQVVSYHFRRSVVARCCFAVIVALAATLSAEEAKLPETGDTDPRLASFDRLMRSFVKENDLPGATLAVGRNGRVVYSRGFGYADVDESEPMQADALMRIASISKPITAVAVFQLIEKGKLKLSDRVTDHLKFKAFPSDAVVDPRWRKITIEHLLEHTGGWDRDESFDAMFRSVEIAKTLGVKPPAEPKHIIRYMLAQPLDFDPGARYAYSNFGYCLLGRVIERLTGQSYEAYVRENVLAPIGIKEMRIGHTQLDRRAKHEVRYYTRGDQKGPAVIGKIGELVAKPYGAWYLEAMDAHGGWIASASDLVRFASCLDQPKDCKILSAKSIHQMFARPAHSFDEDDTSYYYARGWMVRSVGENGGINGWHTGSLDGTSTILVRRHDGLSWAVLFNSRQSADGEKPAPKIDRLVHQAADAVDQWP